MKKKKIIIITLLAIFSFMFLGCSNTPNEIKDDISDWERGTVLKRYTLEELYNLSESDDKTLVNKYIEVEFKLTSHDLLNNLFYTSFYSGEVITKENTRPGWEDSPSQMGIYCLVFKEYWKIGCENDDIVIAAGYVQGFDVRNSEYGYTLKVIYLNPADIRKK